MTDSVNQPSHYTFGKVECIDAIESALGPQGFQSFLRGQVIKYTWRMNNKGNTLQDAQKAQWYQNKLIEKIEQELFINEPSKSTALTEKTPESTKSNDKRTEHFARNLRTRAFD